MNTQQAALNPLVSIRKCLTRTYGGKTTFTHTIAANKRANSYNFKIKKKLEFTYSYSFLAIYLLNKGKSSYIN